MSKELGSRCSEEISNSLYNYLHPNAEDAIYPPDEYDPEAKKLLQYIQEAGDQPAEEGVSNILRTIFDDAFDHRYPEEAFKDISQTLLDIYLKYENIDKNV